MCAGGGRLIWEVSQQLVGQMQELGGEQELRGGGPGGREDSGLYLGNTRGPGWVRTECLGFLPFCRCPSGLGRTPVPMATAVSASLFILPSIFNIMSKAFSLVFYQIYKFNLMTTEST